MVRMRQARVLTPALATALSATLVAAMALLAWIWFASGTRMAGRAVAERRVCDDASMRRTGPHPGMVWVPAGRFQIGDAVYPEEGPPRSVQVEGFWMDRTEVTNDEFAEFVRATGYVTVAERPVDAATHGRLPSPLRQPGAVVFVMPNDVQGRGDVTQWWRYTGGANWRQPGGPGTDIDGRGAFPVVAVTQEDARAYARWKGRSLPSEAQWEWAARAARADATSSLEPPPDANTWQGLFPVINSADDGFVGVAPVACYKPNALGLHDMIGNVWELTTDVWNVPDGAPAQPVRHVIKGGSWLCASNYCMRYRAGARQPQESDLGAAHVGFRTILTAPGP